MKRHIILAGLLLAGCTSTTEPLSPSFGQAVNANIAAQVINPNPVHDDPTLTDGQRIGNAVQRYRTNRVYTPRLPLEGGRIYDQGGFGGNSGNGESSSTPQQ